MFHLIQCHRDVDNLAVLPEIDRDEGRAIIENLPTFNRPCKQFIVIVDRLGARRVPESEDAIEPIVQMPSLRLTTPTTNRARHLFLLILAVGRVPRVRPSVVQPRVSLVV